MLSHITVGGFGLRRMDNTERCIQYRICKFAFTAPSLVSLLSRERLQNSALRQQNMKHGCNVLRWHNGAAGTGTVPYSR